MSEAEKKRRIDEGENFRLSVWRGVGYCEVWRRPDVSVNQGTRYAAVLMNSLRSFLSDVENPVPGLVFDLREAAPVAGPNTLALLAELMTSWSLADRNIVLVVAWADQRDQMEELIAKSAPGRAVVLQIQSGGDVEAALLLAA
ncbi:MAG: hypothetical protein Q8O67_06720 [Deltaproteobacteria bacterium]|nr:hypothetical protein [Deltaproteobacteria bacterium]